MTTLIGKQRDIMQKAFDKLGGIDELIAWAKTPDDKGNMSNYKEFIKLYIKLAPALKTETKDDKDTQESFIMSLIKAENVLKLSKGQPKQLIDVECENQSQ